MKRSVNVVVDEPKWRQKRALIAQIRRAAARAVACAGKAPQDASLTILLTNDESLKRLNRKFRGKNRATNVLSFPAAANGQSYLGDVAIAHGVTRKESERGSKPFSRHATHLAVHGVLHLMGHDHERTREARRMQRLEAIILAEFGIPDPYAQDPKPA